MTDAARETLGEMIRFGIVGVGNTLICAALVLGLAWAGTNPFAANCIGYVAGTLFSFYANARWTFRSPLGASRFWKFIAVILASYAANVAVLALALHAGWGEIASQVPAMVCFTLCNFAGQRLWTFRRAGDGQ
jgi:putative flippase GtrA